MPTGDHAATPADSIYRRFLLTHQVSRLMVHVDMGFLCEAVQITGDARFNKSADEFQRIGDKWQVVAEIFKCASEADDPAAVLGELNAPLLELADLEEAAWSRLRDLLQFGSIP